MKGAWGVALGILFAVAVSEPSSWRSPAPWNNARVQPHSGLSVVSPPQLAPRAGHLARRESHLSGYLPLKPVGRNSRWFEKEPRSSSLNHHSRAGYEGFPPFWSDRRPKTAKSIRPPQQRHARKDCNPCNSVPWTPIFKSPAGLSSNHQARELVPHVEVYPDASIQHASVVSPHLIPPTIAEPVPSLSLPVGNVPLSPNLLLPPYRQLPFPELSPHPVAPVHDHVQFDQATVGLVPPAPPKRANVVVTISESDSSKDANIVPHDQNSESSSFVDTRQNQNQLLPQQNNYRSPSHGLDIVKSVPLAAYTSSIDYPVQLIQSSSYIDINPTPGQPSTAEYTYEKSPKTGSQKVSDYILGETKDTQKGNVLDNLSEGSDTVTENTSTPLTNEPKKPKADDGIAEHEFQPSPQPPLELPPQLTQLLPTYDTAFLHPLFAVENKDVASVVNGVLLPPPQPQPMNPTTVEPKKIQIIIPYTTVNNQAHNTNFITSSAHDATGYNKPTTLSPIVVADAAKNTARRVPPFANQTEDDNEIQHILAENIRDLLKKEAEPKQNIRLQKNIDNWTALEYSNHKIIGKKQPSDVISHANAVTSIPGTSISHLLYPSKKIPDGYFPTSAAPYFDEPTTTPFPAWSMNVNSEPFTTVARYSSVAWSGPTSTPSSAASSATPTPPDEDDLAEETSSAAHWSDYKVSVAPGTNEKVYVVTPVSYSGTRRTTRHVETTEKYNSLSSPNFLTKLEKITETNSVPEKSKKQKPFYQKSTALFRVKADPARYEKVSKFTKPKPIDKFFATTSKPLQQSSTGKPEERRFSKTTRPSTTSESTTPALFPFRNGGEIPLEMSKANISSSQLTFINAGSRKTLIKQVKTQRKPITEDGTFIVTPSTVSDKQVTTTSALEVEVIIPVKSGVKKSDNLTNKKSIYLKKKTADSVGKDEGKPVIKHDEPNITEDDREEINELMKKPAKDNETMLALETSLVPAAANRTEEENSTSLLDTIKLLREFLAETSEDEVSHEQIEKVIEKMNSTGSSDSKYKYNFPEYLADELKLNKQEMNLVKSAMVELQKSQSSKKD